jgi:hypothetical protein
MSHQLLFLMGARGEGSCRNFALRSELTADPPGLQYQGPGTSRKFSRSKTEGSKSGGGGV